MKKTLAKKTIEKSPKCVNPNTEKKQSSLILLEHFFHLTEFTIIRAIFTGQAKNRR